MATAVDLNVQLARLYDKREGYSRYLSRRFVKDRRRLEDKVRALTTHILALECEAARLASASPDADAASDPEMDQDFDKPERRFFWQEGSLA